MSIIFYALLGGILPALLWLWFWLKEDQHPEPRSSLIFSFLAGMGIIILVIPVEAWIQKNFASPVHITFFVIFLWALTEEVAKYIAAYFSSLRRRVTNEPIDPVIYLITTAIGFAALENTLFLIDPISKDLFIQSALTGNMRFIGATLLHVLSSAVIGMAIGLSFYRSRRIRWQYLCIGIVLATLLHTLFNFFIIQSNGELIFVVFSGVWVSIMLLILFFEKVKRIKK